MRCRAEPVATVALRYADREVVVTDLATERDPNLLDLCRDHVDRMTPPLGWSVTDRRSLAVSGAVSGATSGT
jgi:hypothetical protein